MNWFKQNRFLGGLLIVTLLAAGVLGYLLWTAKSKYEETSANFDQQAAELKRLQTLPAFPDQQNLKKLEAQRDEHLALIDQLQKDLATVQFPLEPMTPNAFQDRLRDSVTAFTAQNSGRMKLPTDFYLGFGRYQSAPPTAEAAPLLGRELKAIELVMNVLVSSGITELETFSREELAEEGHTASKPEPATPAPMPGARKLPGRGSDAVRKQVLDLRIGGEQPAFRQVLNKLSTSNQQFLIPRYLLVENSNPKAPSKISDNALADPSAGQPPPAAPAPAAPAAPAPPAVNGAPVPAPATTGASANPGAPAAPSLKTVVGEETVKATMRLEVVNFTEPPADPKSAKAQHTSAK